MDVFARYFIKDWANSLGQAIEKQTITVRPPQFHIC